MHLRDETPPTPSLKPISVALLAVERQKRTTSMLLDADARAQQKALFHYLDRAVNDLFWRVTEAAVTNERPSPNH